METAQEREVQLLQRRQAWPFHTMGMGMGMATAGGGCFDGYGGGGDCFVLGWEQQQQHPAPAAFGCFGLLAADVHDLFPLCTSEPAGQSLLVCVSFPQCVLSGPVSNPRRWLLPACSRGHGVAAAGGGALLLGAGCRPAGAGARRGGRGPRRARRPPPGT